MKSESATLVIRHKSDIGSEAILSELSILAKSQVIESYFSICVEANSLDRQGDFAAEFVTAHGSEQCLLLDRLSRLGVINQVRIICLNASNETLDVMVAIDIQAIMLRVRTVLDQFLGAGISVSEIRIGIRGSGESIPSIKFFPINSNANILVIPHDRIAEGASASPIIRTGEGSVDRKFALHGAVEVASLMGLWSSMAHAPVDNFFPSVSGSEVPRLRFSQSRVRVLIGPPLPMSKIAEPTGDLPLPLQHFAVSNTEKSAIDLAKIMYPSDLIFSEGASPSLLQEKPGGLKALIEFLTEIGRSIFLLPKFIVKGMRSELDSLSSEIYQGALGDESFIKILGTSSTEVEERVGLSQTEFEEIVQAVANKRSRELVSPISRDHWAMMLTRFFGAIDGGSTTRDFRQQLFSNENILLVDRLSAGSSDGDLGIEVTKLLREYSALSGVQKLSSEELLATLDVGTVREAENSDGVASTPLPEFVEPTPHTEEMVIDQTSRRSLVELISDRFMAERKKANNRSEEMIQKIRLLFVAIKRNEVLQVSYSVVAAAWFALCSIIFVLLTCTPIRQSLSFSALSGYTRDALFTSFSGLFVVSAVLLLGYGGKKTWQVRALLTGAAVGVVIAICVVWFDDVRSAIQTQTKASREMPSLILALVTIGLLVMAVFKNLRSKSELRQRLGRSFLLVTSVYLLVSLVLWQCMQQSGLQNVEPATRRKVQLAVLVVAGLILISALGVVALVQIRERFRLRKNATLLEWCRQELEISIEAERRLGAAQIQWSATGAVLGRLLAHPLGVMNESVKDIGEVMSADNEILKYDVARLRLNEQGEAGLVARLRRHYVEPGWLARQYEKMVQSYQAQAAFRSGNKIEDFIDRRPEIDPVVNLMAQAINCTASGDRWDFARSVFRGDYDPVLGAVPEHLNREDVYQSVLENPSLYDLVGSQLVGASAREFLQQVLPTPLMELPSGLTNTVSIAGDNSRKIKSEVWWPRDILGEPTLVGENVVVNPSSSEHSSFFAGAVLLVGIRVDFSEPFSYFDCLGAVDEKIMPHESESRNIDQSDF